MAAPTGRIVYHHDGTCLYFIGTKRVTKRQYDRRFPSKLVPGDGGPLPGAGTGAWPLVSEALAVDPSQVEAANARAKRHGVNVVYDARGFAHIPDRKERKKLLKLEGYHDRSGGYGD